MRTQLMIMLIVLAIAAAAVTAVVLLIGWLGWATGALVVLLALGVLAAVYLAKVRPWYRRWGATDDEVQRQMPGDDLIEAAGGATRAISINANPNEVWPWLVQLGYGKAGWYSYDWIDNDFKRSADRILPEHQSLEAGDTILMAPAMGLKVKSVDPTRSIVSTLEDGSTSWCLAVYCDGEGSRLVSRWRAREATFPASLLSALLIEPGTFVMEQKMLRTIRKRVENHS